MNGTQELADDILKDIFSDQDSLSHRRTYQAKKRKNSVRLVSLTDENNGNSSKYSNSNDHRLNSANNLRHSETSLHGNSSTYSGNSYSPSSNNSNVYSAGHSNTNSSTLSQLNTKNKLKPINHNDHHVVSDIIHRVTNVSGQSPEKKINVANSGASVASSVANNKNIALDSSITNSLNTIITTNHSDNSCDTVTVNNVNEVQRKTLQESSTVKSVMKKVVKLHQDLDAIVHDSLQHRKELASAIDTINKAYITNFEAMLRELLHTQRTKFKTQSKSIMELENEVAVLGGKYLLEKEKVEVQSAANVELTLKLREQSDKVEAKANEIVTLQSQVNSLERKLQKDKEIINEQVEKFNSEVNKMKKEIKIESMRHIEAERLRFTKEINKYKANNNQGDLELEQLKEEVDRYKNRALAFKDMNDFKRPLQDNQTQTIVDDNGLWDKQDGWKELPISKTRLARHHWREAINFTTCKACRGIGNYIYQVGAILKDITRGETMINDEIITDDFCKWSLPDELVRFLSNLPKTIQATNPKSINWLMKRVLVIFELKYHADDDDRKLGYNLQPLTEYIIEIFLLRYKSRTEAEFELYYLIDTLKEHYDKHPLLQLFARFLNILGTLPIEEKRRLKKQQKANENLLKKKKKNDMNVLKARERNKIMYARTQEEIASRKKNPQDAQNGSSVLPYENGFLGKEELLKISSKSLTLEISEIFLFARQLIFYSYSGVYAEKIKAIKETSELLQQKEQSLYNDKDWQLHGKLPEHFCIGIRNSFYIPMDRAIAVIKPFINFLPSETIIKVYHSIESSAVQLLSEGELLLTDGLHTLVRSTMRIFSNAYNPDGADLSWYELYMANSKNFIVRASTDQNSVVDNKNQNDYHCDFNHSLTYFDSITGTERTLGSFITAKRVEKKESKRCNRFNNNEIGCHKFKVGQYNSERLNGESAKTISTGISKDKSNADTIGGLAPVRKDSRANENPHLVETDKGFIDLTIENEDTIAFHESQNTEVFMVDMDLFLQVLVEVLLLKTKEVDNALKKIFIDGDINKDGVLSFTEFNAIVHNVAPQTNQRTILKMFREALMQGDDTDFIGPEAFLCVCKTYGLMKIVDLNELKHSSLSALTDNDESEKRFVSKAINTDMIQFRSNKDKDSFNGMKAISKSLSRSRDERTDVSLVMSPYLKGPPNEIASKQELKSISRDLIMTTRESRPNTQYPELIPEYNSIKDCNVPKAQAELFTDLKDFILINHEKEEHNYADPIPIIHSVPIVSTTNKNNHGKAVTKASSNGREDVGKVQGTKVVLSASVVTIADLNDSGGKTTKETDRQNYLNEKSIAETSKDSVSFARPINKGLKLKTNTEASKESSQKMLEELKARRENRKQLRAEEQ